MELEKTDADLGMPQKFLADRYVFVSNPGFAEAGQNILRSGRFDRMLYHAMSQDDIRSIDDLVKVQEAIH